MIGKILRAAFVCLLLTPAAHGAGKDSTSVDNAYTKLVAKGGSEQHGLFTVRHIDKDWYLEVPDSLLERHLLSVTRFLAVPEGFKLLSGEEVNHSVVYWEEHDGQTLFLREYVQTQFAPEGDRIARSLRASTVDPIIGRFDIVGRNPEGGARLVKVTSFFLEDSKLTGLNTADRKTVSVGTLQRDRSFIDTIKTYPINTEVQTLRTYAVSAGKFPASQSGAVTLKLNTSIVLLPREPMRPRFADERVGYFQNGFTLFSDTQQKTRREDIIHRYRLEPKDPAAYRRGELTEPKRPIVYYIDPATPRKWVPYLKAGVEDWNAAFEAAGFKNAIQAREWGDDPTMSLDDARLSVIRYLPSEQENAYGPRIVDLRSGEIIDSHVCWYHNVMNLLKKWYMVQCGPLDKRARTMTFDDELMGSLIRFVSSHEVGHSLGLRHNMAASSATPVEKLRDKRWVEANGHTVSIMDYARFNYVAQPEDRISPRGLFPRIGVYDRWAVEWGYRWSGDGDPWTEQEALRAEVTRRLKDDPRLFYVGDEGKGADPRSQSEDLGDNNMKANEYGIRNLRRVMEHILDWTRQPDGRHDDLQDIYNAVRAQYIKYVWHVQKNILGRYEGNLPGGRLRDFVGASRQREAVEWFGRNLFDAPLWLYPVEVVQCVDKVDPVTEIYDRQSTVLSYLLAPGLLANLDNASYVASEPYPVSDYLADVHRAVWRSTDGVPERTAYYTRQLERQYVRLLENMLRPATPEARNANLAFERSDARLAVQAHVEALAADVRERLAGCREGTTDYRHFRDLAEKLEKLIRPDEAAPKD